MSSVPRCAYGTSTASAPHISAVRRRAFSEVVRPTRGTPGRNVLTFWIELPESENTAIATAPTSAATCTAACETTRPIESADCGGGGGCSRCGERSATSMMRAIVRTASTG